MRSGVRIPQRPFIGPVDHACQRGLFVYSESTYDDHRCIAPRRASYAWLDRNSLGLTWIGEISGSICEAELSKQCDDRGAMQDEANGGFSA